LSEQRTKDSGGGKVEITDSSVAAGGAMTDGQWAMVPSGICQYSKARTGAGNKQRSPNNNKYVLYTNTDDE